MEDIQWIFGFLLKIVVNYLLELTFKNTINAICFPRNYRDDIYKKGGQEIMDLYDKALNKDKYAFIKAHQFGIL